MGTFQIELKPDDLPETRAMDRHVRGLLEGVLAVGLPDDFGELLSLAFALRTYADTFVCLDVEEYCATLSTSASHLLAGSACSDDPVLVELADCTSETPVARGVRTRPERLTRAGGVAMS